MGYWRATARNYLLTASSLHSAFQSLANARSYGSVPLLVFLTPKQTWRACPPSAGGQGHSASGETRTARPPSAPLSLPPCSSRAPLRGKGQRLSPAFGRLPLFFGYRTQHSPPTFGRGVAVPPARMPAPAPFGRPPRAQACWIYVHSLLGSHPTGGACSACLRAGSPAPPASGHGGTPRPHALWLHPTGSAIGIRFAHELFFG